MRPRCVVLGLDGLPLSLARRMGAHLPNLASLTARADCVTAEAPELSPVNWTSFYTAQGPETHGVFGFTRMDPQSYALSVVDATTVACPTIFDALGAAGLVSRVVNLPNTYPARPLRGMLVAGFVAHEMERAAYPPFLARTLASKGYLLEADTTRGGRDPGYLLEQLAATLASRRMALDLLWSDLAWNLFVFVLTETDRLFHFLFHAVDDPTHGLHGDCMDLLLRWDRLIGEVLERYDALPGPKRLLALADHGFTALRTEVDMNRHLAELGLLRLLPPATHGENAQWEAARIAPQSAAFALDPGRIYLHDALRFARGPLSPADKDRLLPELRQALLGLTFQGEPVMEDVVVGREYYDGPCGAQAPDLLCLARPGFDLKAKFDRDTVFGHFGRTGAHTRHDAFFCDSEKSQPKRVRDVGGEVLAFFGKAACP